MATVWLAHDRKHDRDVAIKVLKPALASSIAADRFQREISIAARLSHPHILPLLDSGAADDDLRYYVMPVVTGESLRERLSRSRTRPLADALRFTTEITEALAYAHANGVVHRDVKPDNVMLSGGHAIVMDFGIAKAIGRDARNTTLTAEGMSMGTPAYMAPEQVTGEGVIDHRADLYAVGAMLYEMLAGAPPFTGTWEQVLMTKLAKDAPALTTAPTAVARLVARCLSREADGRPASAEALLAELRALSAPASPARRTRAPLLLGAAALLVTAVGTLLYLRNQRERWARDVAVPTIARMIDADQLDSAFDLAQSVAVRSPGDSVPKRLWDMISREQEFLSEPAGASVTRAPLGDTTHWIPVGTTPTPAVRIPTTAWYYRYSKPGYRTITVMGARLGGSYVPIPAPVPLRATAAPDSDMVLLRGGPMKGTFYGLRDDQRFTLSDFLMNAREVTNREYKAFVDAGGYGDPRWWDSTIVADGHQVSWEAAMARFVDRTGRPGPSTWEGGAPPREADELPVGGVSWYEARAFARFVGKALPTVYEWNAAAIPDAARWVVPTGRYETNSPVRGGAERSVSPRGVYDLAGNVREWTVNAREAGTRYILGGGYSDPPYLYAELYTQPEMDRSPINGIRLVKRLTDAKDLAAASAPIPGLTRNYRTVKPVDDATFRAFAALYEYDHTPLRDSIVSTDASDPDWVRQEITYDVPGASIRMRGVLFLPKRAKPPFQTVVLFPASDAQILAKPSDMSLQLIDYVVRSGRILFHPIFEHTFGRGTPIEEQVRDSSIAHRDQTIRWGKELRRSVDYLATRPDVDTTRFAYMGSSWGGRLAGVMLAIEPRFRTAVLNVPGLGMSAQRPEEDPVNFLPRIHMPVLMLSGRFDSVFPVELSQKPFYELLGTPAADKKRIVYDGGHFLPRAMMMQESLGWLDKYLGVVRR